MRSTTIMTLGMLTAMACAASAATITSCVTGYGGGGLTVNSCSASSTSTSFLIDETWNSNAQGGAAFNMTGTALVTYDVTKTILNSTNTTWTNFIILAGAGNIGNEITTALFAFNPSATTTITGSSSDIVSATHVFDGTDNLLTWSNLSVPNGHSITLKFSVNNNFTGGPQWQILQQPVGAPECSATLLSGAGLVLVGLLRRRRLGGTA